MSLTGTYSYAIQMAKNVQMDGSVEERGGKLHFKGSVPTQDEANKIWDAIKTIPTWPQDVVADIRATRADAPAASNTTYTVKAGDTLSSISKAHLGDATAYRRIFEVNRDQLTDPNQIKPGQVLKIPTA